MPRAVVPEYEEQRCFARRLTRNVAQRHRRATFLCVGDELPLDRRFFRHVLTSDIAEGVLAGLQRRTLHDAREPAGARVCDLGDMLVPESDCAAEPGSP